MALPGRPPAAGACHGFWELLVEGSMGGEHRDIRTSLQYQELAWSQGTVGQPHTPGPLPLTKALCQPGDVTPPGWDPA